MRIFTGIWNYRGFISGSIYREFQMKFSGSIMGVTWNIFNPLAMVLIYTLIFTEVMRAKLPGLDDTYAYSIYLCGGLLTWGLFSEIANRSITMFIDNSNLLKKISFPRLCLPVVVVGSALINFFIIFGLFSIFLLIIGRFPGWSYLALIPLLMLLIIFSMGLGVLLGVLNVFFRDVGQFFGIFISFWFWLTPIVYPISILPQDILHYMAWNPMALILDGVQGILVNDQWPQWSSLAYPLILSLILCILGLRLFRKRVGEMVDEL